LTSHTPAMSFEELKLRNESLHDAGRVALETVNRYQSNLKKIAALARSIGRMDVLEPDRVQMIDALNDTVDAATLEVDGEIVSIVANLLRGYGIGECVAPAARTHALH
jgi:hypothetical protein